MQSDTVGVPSPGVEVKIAENGEVFYRSPNAVSYYKNPESTASTKDAEGWVATGDAGFSKKNRGIYASSIGPRMWARWPMAACSRPNMWKTS